MVALQQTILGNRFGRDVVAGRATKGIQRRQAVSTLECDNELHRSAAPFALARRLFIRLVCPHKGASCTFSGGNTGTAIHLAASPIYASDTHSPWCGAETFD
jgi:hypothetical protein